MKKIVYIIPGNTESHLTQRSYGKVAKIFQEYDIEPIHVNIDWKKNAVKGFKEYTQEFLQQYKKPKNTEVYILGFSFGATIAFLTAQKTKAKALILCSLSPYFSEDLIHLNSKYLKWFRKNVESTNYSFDTLAPKVKNETYLVVGDKEVISCMIRAKDAKKKLAYSHLYIAKNAKHNIGQKEYLETLREVISKI